MAKKKKPVGLFVACMVVFISCVLLCVVGRDFLRRPVLQTTMVLDAAFSAKYERDGNLYIIDNGTFRLICMDPAGQIKYTVNIDKWKEYVRIYDSVIDENDNLYIYGMEMAYDAYMTTRDIIRQYDANGNYVKDIFIANYDTSKDNPHSFPQFGSMNCEGGILTFSRATRDRVYLYQYNTFLDTMATSIFSEGVSDFSVAQLALKDFNNFIYTTRDGNIYEVKDGSLSLRASFDFSQDAGGIIPWYLNYDSAGNIVFFDMISAFVYRIRGDELEEVVPRTFFESLTGHGEMPGLGLAKFGFFNQHFAGVYGEKVWYYNGNDFRTYDGEITLPERERYEILIVQCAFVLGIFSFLMGLYILIVHILDRYISLFIKQTILIIPIIIIAFIVFYTIMFEFMEEQLYQEIHNKLNIASTISAKLINGDEVDSLRTIRDFKTATYRSLSQTLRDICGDNQDEWNKAYYAAIYKIVENRLFWLAQSNDEINMFRPYAYIEEGTGEYELASQGKPFVNIVPYIYGTWAYSNAPIRNTAGKIIGIIEIGMDMTSYEISLFKQQRELIVVGTFICLVILFVLAVIIFIIIKYLSNISKVLEDIGKGKHDSRVTYRARDEIGNLSSGLNFMAEELQKQFSQISSLNASTIRFVPLQFMKQLGVSDITKMKLGDHVQRNLTVLFFDIRAFSINSEMMSANENFVFINTVLGIAGPIIRKHNGFVDKYLGDAVMALFINAKDAMRAGIELYQDLVLNNETKVKIGGDGINIGVGIHSGSVMMGIVGENERLSSTVISKNVNLASRLESLTKQVRSGMLVSMDTLNAVSGSEKEFQYRFIGMIRAAGVNEVVGVFDVLDALPPLVRKRRIATRRVFESGVRKYHTKDYRAALQRFKKVVEADPEDACARICLEETKRRLQDPNLPSIFMFEKK
ncbi:MAG: adenylate/guanylate cyclase domain-containing protein [Spirochaetaceae bacterium]|jgi:class 3 adenylate cyclase/large-conductance mechanosensitive channel|nr:adenylate/guanylate cyclase domain-containing protein [Spirochaetaceae bacterium]